jgi:hypothetical protein
MPSGWPASRPHRDLRIDWLRGLAMTCVIVNHSRMSSLLTWFSYERFWIVTAAEVFAVLSGIVLGMVYGRRVARDGWLAAMQGLGRRALTLYGAFVLVTLSVVALARSGVDVSSVTTSIDHDTAWWFLDPQSMDAAAWRDVVLMRAGPWPIEIVGLYVWLVAAAVPCVIALHYAGWRPLVALSWTLYIWYRMWPQRLTSAEFEAVFPILAWQLPFVHGVVLGFHRDRISAFAGRFPRFVPVAAASASAAFAVLALCNPWLDGPSWLHWGLVSPERFASLYAQYFALSDLGIGRLVNIAVALPCGYAALTWGWTHARRLEIFFVTLGQQSLGAFVLHVYGILLVALLPHADEFWTNTLIQVMLVMAITAVLYGIQNLRVGRQTRVLVPARAVLSSS